MAMKTVDKSILNRMRGSGAGSVSSARQFLDLSNRSTGGGVASAGEGRDDSAHSTRAFRSTGSASDHRTDGAEHHGDHTGVAGRQPCEVAIHGGLHGERTGNVRASAGQDHHLDGWVAAPGGIGENDAGVTPSGAVRSAGEWPAGGNGDPGAALSEGQPCLGAAPGAVQQDPG